MQRVTLGIATVALFAALGGPGYAASVINGSRIKKNSISADRLTVKARASLKGSTGLAGARGPTGPQGLPGAPGTPGVVDTSGLVSGPGQFFSARKELSGLSGDQLILSVPGLGDFFGNCAASATNATLYFKNTTSTDQDLVLVYYGAQPQGATLQPDTSVSKTMDSNALYWMGSIGSGTGASAKTATMFFTSRLSGSQCNVQVEVRAKV